MWAPFLIFNDKDKKTKKGKKTNLTTYYPVKPHFMSKDRNLVKIKRMEKDTAK